MDTLLDLLNSRPLVNGEEEDALGRRGRRQTLGAGGRRRRRPRGTGAAARDAEHPAGHSARRAFARRLEAAARRDPPDPGDRCGCSSVRTVHREVAGHGSGVRGVRDARAGRGSMTSVKIVDHRDTWRFMRASRALTRRVAQVGSVRTLPGTPVFEVGGAVLHRCPDRCRCGVRQLLSSCQGPVPGGLVNGDHCGAGVGAAVVEPDEAQVGDRPETGRPQLLHRLTTSTDASSPAPRIGTCPLQSGGRGPGSAA